MPASCSDIRNFTVGPIKSTRIPVARLIYFSGHSLPFIVLTLALGLTLTIKDEMRYCSFAEAVAIPFRAAEFLLRIER
jgi:hypothetical protein